MRRSNYIKKRLIFFSLILTLLFQNCSGTGFDIQQGGASLRSDISSIGTPASTPTPAPTPAPTPTPTPTPAPTPAPTPTPTPTPPIEITENTLGLAQKPINGLRYFGYPLWNVDYNVILEMKSHTNAIAFNYRLDNPTELKTLLSHLSSDFKGIIFIDDIFKNPQTNAIYDDATISQNLSNFAGLVNNSMANILYLAFDEPFWRAHLADCRIRNLDFASCMKTSLSSTAQTQQKSFLEKSSVTLRKKFSGASLYLVESGYMMQPSLTLPRNYDLYGFDCYFGFNSCSLQNTVPQTFAIIKNLVTDLNIKYGGHRRLGIVAETSMRYSRQSAQPTTPVSTAKTDEELLLLASQYEALLKNDPMVNMGSL